MTDMAAQEYPCTHLSQVRYSVRASIDVRGGLDEACNALVAVSRLAGEEAIAVGRVPARHEAQRIGLGAEQNPLRLWPWDCLLEALSQAIGVQGAE